MMSRATALMLIAAISLGGCDMLGIGNSSSGGTSDTNMRSVDIQAGTASDEMIILDTASGDGTAIDPSSAVGPAAPRPAAEDEEEGESDSPSTSTAPEAASTPSVNADAADAPEPAEK
jgi:hypothetical protein